MRRILMMAISVILALMLAAPLASAQAGQRSARHEQVEKLGAAWWQWAGSPPTATNPTVGSYSYKTDVGAIKCNGSNPSGAWFLAGTSSGPSTVTRTCTAPAHTKIFFPVFTFVCGPAWSDPFNTARELEKECTSFMDTALSNATPYAKVDGKSVRIDRAHTAAFKSKVPKDNPFGVVGGTSIAVADGLWVLLPEGLSKGKHTVKFGGTITNPFVANGPPLSQNVTYKLTVK